MIYMREGASSRADRAQLRRIAWICSTKIEALLEELTKLREAGDTTKSIVFSQFVNFLDLIEWRLQKAGFRCVKVTPPVRQLRCG